MAATTDEIPLPSVEGVSHHYAKIDGLRIHYAEAGEGAPLLLVHGWPQHWYAWHKLIPTLATTYRVICPDIRGLGWSEGPRRGYGFQRLGQDILDLMDVLRLRRARLVGHDWGGVAGYQACLDHPGRFVGYTALATAHPWFLRGAPPTLMLRSWHFYVLAAPGGRKAVVPFGIAESRLRAWRRSGEFSEEEIAIYARPTRTARGANATMRFYRRGVLREVPRQALTAGRRRLSVPTLHLNGALDHLTRGTPHSYRKFAPNMTMEEVAGAGHFIAEEQPALVLERLQRFFG